MLSIRIRQELYEDFFFNVCFPVVLPFNLKLLGCSQTLLQAPLMRQKLWWNQVGHLFLFHYLTNYC